MNDPVASIAGLAQHEPTASVQALALPKGLYVFSVKSADPERVAELGGLMLPAMHIGVWSECSGAHHRISVRPRRKEPLAVCPGRHTGGQGRRRAGDAFLDVGAPGGC